MLRRASWTRPSCEVGVGGERLSEPVGAWAVMGTGDEQMPFHCEGWPLIVTRLCR